MATRLDIEEMIDESLIALINADANFSSFTVSKWKALTEADYPAIVVNTDNTTSPDFGNNLFMADGANVNINVFTLVPDDTTSAIITKAIGDLRTILFDSAVAANMNAEVAGLKVYDNAAVFSNAQYNLDDKFKRQRGFQGEIHATTVDV